MPKILRTQLPVLFAKKETIKDKETNQPKKNEDGTDRMITNFYVLLPSGKYVRVMPYFYQKKDGTKDLRDMQRLLDNVPCITSVEDIVNG